jgi:hypothetical protein
LNRFNISFKRANLSISQVEYRQSIMMSNVTLTCQVGLELIAIVVLHKIILFPIFMLCDFVLLLLLLIMYEWTCFDRLASTSVGWLVSLSRFIYQLCVHDFFMLFFCLSLFISLCICKNMCVCEWVSMKWGVEANAHTYRDNIKKNETEERTPSIHPFIYSFTHSFIACSPLLLA